jgi:hypothetical protein
MVKQRKLLRKYSIRSKNRYSSYIFFNVREIIEIEKVQIINWKDGLK